jgi:hypothetical protein
VITVPGSNGGFFKVYPTGNAEYDAQGVHNFLQEKIIKELFS